MTGSNTMEGISQAPAQLRPTRCHCCSEAYHTSGIVLNCPRCGHVFRPYEGDPVAFHASVYRKDKRFYRHSNEFSATWRPTPAFHKARRWIVKGRKRLIRPYLRREARCLDIGSGAGTFADHIRRRVASIDCLELDPNLVGECRRLGFRTFETDFLHQEFEGPYDIVFAWHVLEHVPDASRFIEKAARLARHFVIVEVPWRRRVPETFDGHYHYFTNASLRLILREPRVVEVQEGGVQQPALFAVARGEAV